MAEWMRGELADAIYGEYLDVKKDLIEASEEESDVAYWEAFSFRDYLAVLTDDSDILRLLAADEGLPVCLNDGCSDPAMGGTIHGLCRKHYDEWAFAYFKP